MSNPINIEREVYVEHWTTGVLWDTVLMAELAMPHLVICPLCAAAVSIEWKHRIAHIEWHADNGGVQ